MQDDRSERVQGWCWGISLLVSLAFAFTAHVAAKQPASLACDVAVFGGTPSGIASAIAARRAGIPRVVLADPSAHVGGRFAETIGFSEVFRMQPESVGGMWTELRKKVDAHYGKETHAPEPYVMEQILREWLAAEGVVLAERFQPVKADKAGPRLLRVHADHHDRIEASVFIDNGHWPYDLYAREGRRMLGDFVMTQRDLFDDLTKPDAIALGSFPVDSHVVRRLAAPDGKQVINEGGFLVIPPIYEIPYRVLIPKAAECDNLLATCAASVSRVAFNSFRVEPTWMMLGEAAGNAAAIASRDEVPVQQVDLAALRKRLQQAAVPFDRPGARAAL